MSDLEAQKQRIAEFFKGVRVGGIEREVRFGESEEGYVGVELVAGDNDSYPMRFSIPVIEIDPQQAIIAEILGKAVQPSECNDLARVVMLDADRYGNSAFCKFHKYRDAEISQTHLPVEAVDRFVAAWIAWRVKNYEAPEEGSDPGDEDSAF